jgi:hypothetical protein
MQRLLAALFLFCGLLCGHAAYADMADGAGHGPFRRGPTFQSFLSGSGTYATPPAAVWIEVEEIGAGGGGSGSGTSGGGTGGNGGNTCWNTTGAACTNPVYQAGGGVGATFDTNFGGAGGTVSGSGTCMRPLAGGAGQNAVFVNSTAADETSGAGGVGFYGGAGGSVASAIAGGAGVANSGAGGAGGGVSVTTSAQAGAGGGAGAFCRFIISNPATSYTYAVGAAGTAGTAGASGAAGGAGGSGFILVIEHYAP